MQTSNEFTLTIHYPTGRPTEFWIAKDPTWHATAIGFERELLSEALKFPKDGSVPYLNRAGIYILRGTDPISGALRNYVGRAEDIRARIDTHRRNLVWWSDAIAVVGCENGFTESECKFIEATLYRIARDARRAVLMNKVVPSAGRPDDAALASLLKMVGEIVVRLNALGVQAFAADEDELDSDEVEDEREPTASAVAEVDHDPVPADAEFVLRHHKEGLCAFGRGTAEDRFEVLEGSTARLTPFDKILPDANSERERLRSADVLEEDEDGGRLVFKRRSEFASRLLARQVVLGSQARGRSPDWEPISQ